MTQNKSTATHARAVGLAFSIGLVGCGHGQPQGNNSNTPIPENTSLSFEDPELTLRQIFRRYRNADSYRDQAVASVTIDNGKTRETQTAPLRVSFKNGRLNVQAYDTRMSHTGSGLTAWFAEEISPDWSHQILRGPALGRRPDVDQLLRDPILAQQIGIGAAGPPPQLEWLFSPEPMARLFKRKTESDRDTVFSWKGNQEGLVAKLIDGHSCHPALVTQATDSFVFWIDTTAMLIRRIDFPVITIDMQRRIFVSVLLHEATFKHTASPQTLPLAPSNGIAVTAFVPPPPSVEWLDASVSQLSLRDPGGRRFRFDAHAKFHVGLILDSQIRGTDDPGLLFLDQWSRQMPRQMRSALNLGVVLLGPSIDLAELNAKYRPSLDFFASSEAFSGATQILTVGSIFAADRNGRLVWKQSLATPQDIPLLGGVLADLLDGVPVRDRILDQAITDQKAFENALNEVLVDP